MSGPTTEALGLELGDPVLDAEHLETVAGRHAHVKLVEIAGADHDLPLARPGVVLDQLRALGSAAPA